MKRIWKITNDAKPELILKRYFSSNPLIRPLSLLNKSWNPSFLSQINVQTRFFCSNNSKKIIHLFTERVGSTTGLIEQEKLIREVAKIRDELVDNISDSEKIIQILKLKDDYLSQICIYGPIYLVLLNQLKLWPQLALEVFNWRRKQANDDSFVMETEEYAKGITIAGRLKDIDLAINLFVEAASKGVKTTSTYNALMGAYMYNGLDEKTQTLFRELKRDVNCSPTIVTYNILISVFGRLMLVRHMEETFQEVNELDLSPNLNTYNNLIAGYVTAWMWDEMEKTFKILEKGPIKPDINTYLLMLRGYAHSCQLEKMEKTYELVKLYVNEKEAPLIRAMICAYCKSSDLNRIKKIEALVKLIPKEDYRPWLNVLLIRVYAQENLMEDMESYIEEAFERKTVVTKIGVMIAIITSYFRRDAVDKLANFLKQAECAGWKICRSVFHCKMVMLSAQNRLNEMENVLDEMERCNIDPTKKTFIIMYKAYRQYGQNLRKDRVLGVMCKHGFGLPVGALSSS